MRAALFLVVFSVTAFSCSGKLPPYISPCSRKADLTECLLRNVENIRPHLEHGIPELGVPSFAPYHIDELTIEKEEFEFGIRDVNYTHFEEFTVDSLSYDPDSNFVKVSVGVPRMLASGTYWFVGWNYGAFFNATGNVLGRAVNCTFNFTMTGKHATRGGSLYTDVEMSDFTYETQGPGFLYFENLVPDDPEKSLYYNVLINENFESFMRSIDPFTERVVGDLSASVTRAVFGNYPIDELFLD